MFIDARGAAPRPPTTTLTALPFPATITPIHRSQTHRYARDAPPLQPAHTRVQMQTGTESEPHPKTAPHVRSSSPSFLCTLRPETGLLPASPPPLSPRQRHLFLGLRLTFWSPIFPKHRRRSSRKHQRLFFLPPSDGNCRFSDAAELVLMLPERNASSDGHQPPTPSGRE